MLTTKVEGKNVCLQGCTFLAPGTIHTTDSAIYPPPPPQRSQRFSLSTVFMAARHERKDAIKIYPRAYFLVCERLVVVLSNDHVGVARGGIVFKEIRPGAGFKTGDFVQEKLRGLPTVGRRTTHTCLAIRA